MFCVNFYCNEIFENYYIWHSCRFIIVIAKSNFLDFKKSIFSFRFVLFIIVFFFQDMIIYSETANQKLDMKSKTKSFDKFTIKLISNQKTQRENELEMKV